MGKRPAVVTVSDEQGRFSYLASEIKVAFLWATHPDWLPSRRCHFEIHGDGPRDLVLAPSRGRLELRILQEERPVAGAEVELDWGFDHPAAAFLASNGSMQSESESCAGETDALGRIVLRKPARPDVLLRVRRPGRACHAERLALDAGDSSLDVSAAEGRAAGGLRRGRVRRSLAHARVDLLTRGGRDSLAPHGGRVRRLRDRPRSGLVRAARPGGSGARGARACSRPASSGPCACGWRARRSRSPVRVPSPRRARSSSSSSSTTPRSSRTWSSCASSTPSARRSSGSTRRTVAGSPSPSAARSPSRSGCPASGPGRSTGPSSPPPRACASRRGRPWSRSRSSSRRGRASPRCGPASACRDSRSCRPGTDCRRFASSPSTRRARAPRRASSPDATATSSTCPASPTRAAR